MVFCFDLLKKCSIAIALISCSNPDFLHAQALDSQSKSLPSADTLVVYKRIRNTAIKHKFTWFLYRSIFIEPAPVQYEKKPLSDQQKLSNPYQQFNGKIIRKITIKTLDPFGFSVLDSIQNSVNTLQKAGNFMHIISRQRTIRNRLIFKTNESLDVLKLLESERLLRNENFINDAKIYVHQTSTNSDSADIEVIVQDKWSLDPTIAAGTTWGSLRLRDKNLLGLGHTLQQTVTYKKDVGTSLTGNYLISSLGKSFVSTNLFYVLNATKNEKGIQFERPFIRFIPNLPAEF